MRVEHVANEMIGSRAYFWVIIASQLVDETAAVLEPDGDRVFEVMDGIRTEKLMGASEVRLANWLAFAIN